MNRAKNGARSAFLLSRVSSSLMKRGSFVEKDVMPYRYYATTGGAEPRRRKKRFFEEFFSFVKLWFFHFGLAL
ncbi:hypothetical protein [uncultured Pyramidobacter sp.]|nr:hypothetical protein [uncultured Pyramidobacter sp.]